jgi:two-component sensor histidine kinase
MIMSRKIIYLFLVGSFFFGEIKVAATQKTTPFSVDTTVIQSYLEQGQRYLQVQNDSVLWAMRQAINAVHSVRGQQIAYGGVKQLSIRAGQQFGNFQVQRQGFEQLRAFSQQLNNDSLLAVSSYGVAVVQHTLGEHLLAAKSLEEIDGLLAGNLLSVQQTATILLLKAEVYNALLQHDKAILYYTDVLRLSQEHQLYDKKASSLHGLAELHQIQGNKKEALRYAQEHLEASQKTEQLARIAVAHVQLGTLYLAYRELENNYAQLAEEQLLAGLEKGERSQYLPIVGLANLQLGIRHQQEEALEPALNYLQQALLIFEQVGDQGNQLRALLQLAVINQKLAQQLENTQAPAYQDYLKAASTFAQQAYQNSQTLGVTEVALQAVALLVAIKAQQNNYYEAYTYLSAYTDKKDSLLNAEKLQVIAETEARFQTEQKELQIELLNQEKATRQLWLYGVGGSLLLALGLLGMGYRLYRQKQKINRQLLQQNQLIQTQKELLQQRHEEKELLLKEIHHRVKNNLQIISSLLDLQSKGIRDKHAALAIEDGQSRIRSMALIHHRLYQNEQLNTVNVKAYTEQLLQHLLDALTRQAPDCRIDIDPQLELDIDTAIPIGLIMNELLTNAFKYAFDEPQHGKLRISLSVLGEGRYELNVKDNGKGLPQAFDFQKTRSLGLRLVRRLSKQLFGKATYTYEKGSLFSVAFKDTLRRQAID